MTLSGLLSTKRETACPGTGCSRGAHGQPAKKGYIAYREFGGGRRGFTVKYRRCTNCRGTGVIRARGVS
jgi:hypothetical protein